MPYTHFRYIAYQVPTVGVGVVPPNQNLQFLEVPPGNNPGQGNYPGLKGNVAGLTAGDSLIRVQRFIRVLNLAYDKLQDVGTVGSDPHTLKIFMAPEFYFRPTSQPSTANEPAYSYDEYRAIKDVLRRTIGGDARFEHWLVVPGTIMWKWTRKDPSNSKRPLPQGVEDVYFNTSLYIKGGDLRRTSTHVIEKAEASRIDGLPTGRHGVPPGPNAPQKKATDEAWRRYLTPQKRRKHVFACDETNCGLEICLEHKLFGKYGLLKGLSNHMLSRPEYPDWGIQLQLLTAGGMPIEPASVAVKKGGYIMRTDGLGNGLCTGLQSNLCKVTGYRKVTFLGGEANYNTIPSTATLEPDPESPNVADADFRLLARTAVDMNRGNELYIEPPVNYRSDYWFQQCIKIYQRKPLT